MVIPRPFKYPVKDVVIERIQQAEVVGVGDTTIALYGNPRFLYYATIERANRPVKRYYEITEASYKRLLCWQNNFKWG